MGLDSFLIAVQNERLFSGESQKKATNYDLLEIITRKQIYEVSIVCFAHFMPCSFIADLAMRKQKQGK